MKDNAHSFRLFALLLLLAINLFNYIDRTILSAAIPKIQRDLFPEHFQSDPGGNPRPTNEQTLETLTGLLGMAFMVSYMVAAPVFGWLADYCRRWWLVALGVAVWSLASGASGLAVTYGIMLATRCFVGIGEAAYGPLAPTLLSDYYPLKVRGMVLSLFYLAIPVGSALGYAFGGIMADSWLGWRWAFYLVVPPGLLLALLCMVMPEPPVGQSDRVQGEYKPRLRDFVALFKSPSWVLCTAGMTAMTFSIGGIAYWIPKYIHEYRGQPELGEINTVFGIIVVATGLTATFLGGLAGDLLQRWFSGSYFMVSGIAMLLAFPLSVLFLYVPFPWAWWLLAGACFCLFFNTGPTNTILANTAHPALRAGGFALNIFIIHALGDAISPAVIGWVTDKTGGNMNLAFLLMSTMILAGGICWLAGTPFLERDTRRALEQLPERR
ncbi:MAG: MFS transporter [Gemmataceae bacterium]